MEPGNSLRENRLIQLHGVFGGVWTDRISQKNNKLYRSLQCVKAVSERQHCSISWCCGFTVPLTQTWQRDSDAAPLVALDSSPWEPNRGGARGRKVREDHACPCLALISGWSQACRPIPMSWEVSQQMLLVRIDCYPIKKNETFPPPQRKCYSYPFFSTRNMLSLPQPTISCSLSTRKAQVSFLSKTSLLSHFHSDWDPIFLPGNSSEFRKHS